MSTSSDRFQQAVNYRQQGRADLAERLCHEILQDQPDHAEALHLLGSIAFSAGIFAVAADLLQRAVIADPENATYHSNLGTAYRMAGNLEDAVASFRRAAAIGADHASTHNNLGAALTELGELDEAVASLRQALELQPDDGDANWNLGKAFALQNKWELAVDCLQKAATVKPDVVEIHMGLSDTLAKLGRYREAQASCRRVLALSPGHAPSHNYLGTLLRETGDPEGAIGCFRRAIELQSDYGEAASNLGATLNELGRFEQAAAILTQAAAIQTHHPPLYCVLGESLRRCGRLDESLAAFRRALELEPNLPDAECGLGAVYDKLGRPEDAVPHHRRAIELQSDHALAHNRLGAALVELRQLDAAENHLRRAVEASPGLARAHTNLGILLLSQGRLSDGWDEYEWRLRCGARVVSDACRPRWYGSSLQGRRIALFAEQGLGDTIHFIRYAQLLKQQADQVIVQCQRPLHALLSTCSDIDRLIPSGDDLPEFDIACPLMSVPRFLGATLDNIPAPVPYLHADKSRVEQWRQRLMPERTGMKIGIAWQGAPGHKGNRLRTASLSDYEPLAGVPGVTLISLQKGECLQTLESVRDRFSVVDFSSQIDSGPDAFLDTAAIMKSLDLVVTIDTSIAHLAGALGVPVWVALSIAPDWRWFLDRSDTPWYPSMRLFRQTQRAQWREVFEAMAAELHRRLP